MRDKVSKLVTDWAQENGHNAVLCNDEEIVLVNDKVLITENPFWNDNPNSVFSVELRVGNPDDGYYVADVCTLDELTETIAKHLAA